MMGFSKEIYTLHCCFEIARDDFAFLEEPAILISAFPARMLTFSK